MQFMIEESNGYHKLKPSFPDRPISKVKPGLTGSVNWMGDRQSSKIKYIEIK